jgi:pimeloyl-ACP methyl ester carboxylesterase
MSTSSWSLPMQRELPIILIRGFGGIDTADEQNLTYQGFNDGSVYPQKRGENYIYEGMILRFLKSNRKYHDATNVVGYYAREMTAPPAIPKELKSFDTSFFQGRIIIDPAMALRLLKTNEDPCKSLWVFRYYDLNDRKFEIYGEALVRLISFIRALAQLKFGTQPKVNIIAHSMGGLIVREAIQRTYPKLQGQTAADSAINKIVTLGTPHKGISFQVIRDFRWLGIEAANELEHFNPEKQKDPDNPASFTNLYNYFPLERILTIVGTNYRTYSNQKVSELNRLFSVSGEYGPAYNRSDGLVKQAFAQLDGVPRTFVHKCHGGYDSLITARESFEIATRFFFGDVRVRLRQISATVLRGSDWFGRSEFFFGVSIKPRGVDFELFHQSKEAENCYGPFRTADFSDNPDQLAFSWADNHNLIWEGYLNKALSLTEGTDLIIRLEFYVSERDIFGIGFSDNIVFHKQYYVRALLQPDLQLYLYTGEEFINDNFQKGILMRSVTGGWEFDIEGTGFKGTYRIELETIPEAEEENLAEII